MMQQGAWTFRYSLEGFLKRVLHGGAAPRTESELVEAVLCDWTGEDEKSLDSIPARVHASLTASNGAFAQLEDERFTLREEAAGDELVELSYAYLKEQGSPQKHGEILRRLQSVTGRGRGELMSHVNLDRDPRFVRLESGEWLLTEWELVNDAIANLMAEFGQRRADRTDLLALIAEEEEYRGKMLIFQPELDPRFAVVDEQVDCLLVESEGAEAPLAEVAATVEVEEQLDTKEEAETRIENEEEAVMTETTLFEEVITEETSEKVSADQLVDNVLAMVFAAANELNVRNGEIPNEVLALFNREDLSGIEALMSQRKRLAALAEDLTAVVAKWSGADSAE